MKLVPHLQDREITLRSLEIIDAADPYLQWMKDDRVTRFLEARFSAHTRKSLGEFINTSNRSPNVLLAGIFIAANHVGNIKLNIDAPHKRGEIGILVGDRTFWGQGIGRRSIGLLAGYAFSALGLVKLSAGCYGQNAGSIRAFQAAGFAVEAVRKHHYLDGGARTDCIHLARFHPDWGDEA